LESKTPKWLQEVACEIQNQHSIIEGTLIHLFLCLGGWEDNLAYSPLECMKGHYEVILNLCTPHESTNACYLRPFGHHCGALI